MSRLRWLWSRCVCDLCVLLLAVAGLSEPGVEGRLPNVTPPPCVAPADVPVSHTHTHTHIHTLTRKNVSCLYPDQLRQVKHSGVCVCVCVCVLAPASSGLPLGSSDIPCTLHSTCDMVARGRVVCAGLALPGRTLPTRTHTHTHTHTYTHDAARDVVTLHP